MEMSELPDGWRSCRLADITLPYKTRDPLKQPEDSFTYIDLSSVDNEVGRIASPKILPGKDAPSRARKVVKARDVIFATTRPYLKGIALVPAEYDEQICSTGFSVLRAQPDVLLPRWLYYACRSNLVLDQVLPHMRGASYPAVTDRDVLAATIPIPPLAERQRIVARIKKLAARIEQAHLLRREATTEINALDASASNVLFDEDMRCDWPRRSLGTVADIRAGVTLGRKLTGSTIMLPYLRVANVQDGHLDLGVQDLARLVELFPFRSISPRSLRKLFDSRTPEDSAGFVRELEKSQLPLTPPVEEVLRIILQFGERKNPVTIETLTSIVYERLKRDIQTEEMTALVRGLAALAPRSLYFDGTQVALNASKESLRDELHLQPIQKVGGHGGACDR